jgi:hypothetical protein
VGGGVEAGQQGVVDGGSGSGKARQHGVVDGGSGSGSSAGSVCAGWRIERQLQVAVDLAEATQDMHNITFGGQDLEPGSLEGEGHVGQSLKGAGN